MKDISFKPLAAFIVALFVIATGDVRALPQQGKIESGSGDLSNPERIIQNSQNLRTSWHSFDIGKNEVVNISQPSAASSIVIGVRNGLGTNINGTLNANGHVTLENPAGIQFGASSVVNVGGLVATTTQGGLSSLGQINATNEVHLQNVGGNIVNVGGAVSAKKIIVESNGDVVIGATADLSASEVSISDRYDTHTTPLEAGVFVRATAEGENIILTEADFTDAGYTIINGVLDLGTDGLILRAGGSGFGMIELPTSVTSIRSSSVTLLGFIEPAAGADLTFTSAGDLSFTGAVWINRHVTLEGADITLSGTLSSSGDVTVTATGKLLFGNGTNHLRGANVSLTSAIAPTAADVAVITGGRTTIRADGGKTVTLNAKINVGTAGTLLISTRSGERLNRVLDGGAIVFGTTAPVELTAKVLRFRTSSTGGTRGTHLTTLTTFGTEGAEADAFIEVQGRLLFADVNITSSGGFKVPNVGDASGDVTSYTSRLHASGVMRVTLGTPTDAIDDVLASSTGGSLLHGLSFFALGGIYWDEGGIDNQRDRVVGVSRSYISISIEGDSVIKGNGVTTNSASRPLGAEGDSGRQAGVFRRETAEGEGIILTEEDFTDAGYTIINGVLDLGKDGLILLAGSSGFGLIELPTSVTSIKSSSVTLLGFIEPGIDSEAGLTFTSAGDLSFTGDILINGNVTLEGNDITLSGILDSSGDLTVTARGKLLFGNGNNSLIATKGLSLTSATAPTPTDVAVITGGTTTIRADGGKTVTLNAKINVGTAGRLLITTRSVERRNRVLDGGAIVFGTTAPVELTAKELVLRTSLDAATGGVRGTHLTTLTAAGATGAEGEAFIEVQGSLNFADVDITSSGGFKVANLGDASGEVTSYESRLDASGEWRINLGAPTDVTTGDVLASSTSTGGSLLHELYFFALGNLNWEKGGIDNQIGRVSLVSRAFTSISKEGDSVIKGKGVRTNSRKHPSGDAHRGAHAIWLENTDADAFIFSGAVIDTKGDVMIKSVSHIRFRPGRNAFIGGNSVTYEARKEIPSKSESGFRLLKAEIELVALEGNVNVTGYLEATTDVENLRHRVILRAQQGSIIFGDFTDGTLTQTKLTGNSIILDVKNDFTALDAAPALFSVTPDIDLNGVNGASVVSWQDGVFIRRTAEGTDITLTATELTTAGYTIANGVLNLGTESLVLQAGTSGSNTIELPAGVTEIRAGVITIVGSITTAEKNGLTLTSAATLSATGAILANDVTLEGTDITLSGRLHSHDLTVTARGKLLFGNDTNSLRGDNISLTSATAPTAADVAVITAGTTTIETYGGTITLNAKINVGTAGTLEISTRNEGSEPFIIADGAIVFGTTAPVELTANILRIHTSSTGGARGGEKTTLTAAGAEGAEGDAFIEVQGRFNFADVDITSSGGFKVADLGAAGNVTSYTSRLDASGEIRINLGDPTDVATGAVLASSTSTGGTLVHNLVFFATGDFYWDKGGIDNQLGRVSFFSRAYASISVVGDTVIKGKGVTTNSPSRPLDAARRGVHAIWLENTDADAFIFSGAVLDTVGDVTIKSASHIRFRPNVNAFIRGRNVTYEARKEIPRTFRLLKAKIVLFALTGNVNVTGYLEATTNEANLRHRVTIRAQQGGITFGAFTDGVVTKTTVIGNKIILDVKDDFQTATVETAPATFSVAPYVTVSSAANGGTAQPWLVKRP